jgi:3-oxoacyl-[acyl-carrier protein] reductase
VRHFLPAARWLCWSHRCAACFGEARFLRKALAGVGFDIANVSLEPAEDASLAMEDIRATGRNGVYLQRDIADTDAHRALLDAIEAELGAIDCLINNAGVTSLRRGDLLELSRESFDRSVAINLRGTFFLTQAVARSMVARHAGNDAGQYRSIVTITSANAEIVGVNRGDYCMTKAALSMMSKLFATRLAPQGIHVFELRPGIIRTDMIEPATATPSRSMRACCSRPRRRRSSPRRSQA